MNMYDMFEGWGTDDVTGYANGYTLWTRTQSGQPGEPRYWLYQTPAELRGRDDRVIAAAIRGQEPVAKFGSAQEAFIAMKKLATPGVSEGVNIVDQDSDLDQQVFTLNVDGETVSFTYWDYENNFQSPDIKDIYQQAREQLGKKLSPEQIKAVARSVFKSFDQGVAEASPETTFNALKGLKSWQVVVMNNYYRGKYPDYSGRHYYVLATSPEEAEQVVLDNADAILQELLAMKSVNGRKILPRSSAVPITADRIGQVRDGTEAGRMSTAGFKKMFSPQGPMLVKLSNGAIVDVQGQEQGVAEDAFAGINITMDKEDDEIMVRADAGGRHLGHVLFVIDDGYLMPQDLEVDERFRGQGIAAAMYDYVKSQGYKIRRSGQQTDAGAAFWDKHRSGENVWEQGVSESDPSGLLSAAKTMNRSFIITADLAEGGRKQYRVRAQSERVAREKFAQHANQAKIVSVEEEFKEVDLGQADARKTAPAGKGEQEKTFSNFQERLKKIIHDVAVNPDIAPEHKKAVLDALVQKVVNEEQRRVKDTSAEKLAKRLKRSGYDMDERARYWDEKLRELERQRQEYEQDHSDVKEGLRDPEDNPCWKGYKPVGTKKKNGRTVPNCVPTNEEFAQFVVESLGVIELAERIFNGLEARYPDIVRRYGHDVVGDAVMDTAEEFAETGSTDVEAMIDSAVERLTQTVDQLDERKEADADPAVLSTRVHDPELKWMLGRIKSHYPGLDKEEAFMKFVERALMHSEETDQKHDRAIKQIQQDVSNLKSAGAAVAESRHYFAVAGTKDHELRRNFGMRKDRQGWYLSESADNFKSLYLEATRTFTQLK